LDHFPQENDFKNQDNKTTISRQMRWDYFSQDNDFYKYQDNKTTISRQMRWYHLPQDNDFLNTKTTRQR